MKVIAALLMTVILLSAIASDRPHSVATVTPIAYSLSIALLEYTGVKVVYIPPKRLPINRVPSWLQKNLTRKFPSYDVFVSISDAAPDYAFSHSLRQTNIRLLTIDVAYARLPKGERVVIDKEGEYFWLNSNNMLLMLGILKRDLSLVWPQYRELIQQNYQRSSRTIRETHLHMENLLVENDIAALTIDSARLYPIAGSLSLDVMDSTEAEDFGLKALRVIGKKREAADAATNWVIDDFSRFADQAVGERQAKNLVQLKEVLTNN